MIELILTILFSTLVIITFRLMGLLKIDELQAITFNYLFAVLYGFVIWREPFSLNAFVDKPWFNLSLIIGLGFILTFFLMSRSTKSAGVAITAVASRMSVLIPVFAGFFIFQDHFSMLKVGGILLAVISFFLIFKPEKTVKPELKYILLPFFLFLGIGTNDTLMKFIELNYLQHDETLFLTAVFFVAFTLCTIYLLTLLVQRKINFSYKNILAGFVLGSFNFWSTYFFISSMMHFESTVFFPVVNVSIVCLSAIIGLVFFRERFQRINWIGIFIAIIAITIISIA